MNFFLRNNADERISEILMESLYSYVTMDVFGYRGIENKIVELPEEHRCICGRRTALRLLDENRPAGVMLDDLLWVLNNAAPCKVEKVYNTEQHGIVVILRK